MRVFSICLLFLIFSFNVAYSDQTNSINANRPFALVELFASEGCSSCPPADDLLAQINQEAHENGTDVFVLSFEVDYWDYLGWRSPYSSPAFTQRQREYAKVLRSSSVYTPQMIVNGVNGFVGSDERKARQFIKQSLNTPSSNLIKLEVQNISNGQITIQYQCQQLDVGTVLNIALVERKVQSQVTAGENNGRLLIHTHIVRDFKTIPITEKDGRALIEMPITVDLGNYLIIGYIQEEESMKILAANSALIK